MTSIRGAATARRSRAGSAMCPASPPTASRSTIGDTLFIDLRLVGWADRARGDRRPVPRRRDQAQATWIWVYHAPPSQSPTSWGGSRSYGDVELDKWIEEYQPDIVFAGHVHQAPFVKEGRGSTGRLDLGVQCRPPVRRAARPSHGRHRGEGSVVVFGRRARIGRPRPPLARPVEKLPAPPDWLTSADRPTDPVPA